LNAAIDVPSHPCERDALRLGAVLQVVEHEQELLPANMPRELLLRTERLGDRVDDASPQTDHPPRTPAAQVDIHMRRPVPD
jgi:hypothetical protein